MKENPNDLSERVERLEAFEDRLGLRLQGLFAHTYRSWCTWQEEGQVICRDLLWLQLNGEVVGLDNKPICPSGFSLVAVAYDAFGRVAARESSFGFGLESFLGFAAFSINMQIEDGVGDLSRIRIYPIPY